MRLLLVFSLLAVAFAVLCPNGVTTTLTASTGVITDGGSPYYINNMNCLWQIAPAGITANQAIELTFSRFASEPCCDYLSVYDGTSTAAPLLLTQRGFSVPTSIVTTGQRAFLRWYTDGSVLDRGFELSYRVVNKRTCSSGSFGANCEIESPPVDIADAGAARVLRMQSTGAFDGSMMSSHPIGVALKLTDPKYMYINDNAQRTTTRCNYPDRSGCTTIRTHPSGASNTAWIQYDTLNNLVFWVDEGAREIWKANADGSSPVLVLSRTGLAMGNPRGLVLDPAARKIYFSDWMSPAFVASVNYDGTSPLKLKEGSPLVWPNGIALHQASGRLYIADGFTSTIYTMTTTGTGFTTLRYFPANVHFFGLNYLSLESGGRLYWTDWRADNIASMAANGTGPIVTVKSGFSWPMQLAFNYIPSDCSLTTPACSGHGTCVSGSCSCQAGYTGAQCQTALPTRTCPDSCSGHGTCDIYRGECTCADGWVGANCGRAIASSLCRSADFRAATYSQVQIGEDNIMTFVVRGYNVSRCVIASGNPVLQTNPNCIFPASRTVGVVLDPTQPCRVELTCSLPVPILERCPDVRQGLASAIPNTQEMRVPLHVVATLNTGTAPTGELVLVNRYQSMNVTVLRTVSLEASATMFSMSPANYSGLEKGNTFYDGTASKYVVQFSIWNNGPYQHTLPTVPVIPGSVDSTKVAIERRSDFDRCANPNTWCERAYQLTITTASTCGLEGIYQIQSQVTCRDATQCPEGVEGPYRASLSIVPGDCVAKTINQTVTGRLTLAFGSGTAAKWGTNATLTGELFAATNLQRSRLAALRVCLRPATGGKCPVSQAILLVSNDVVMLNAADPTGMAGVLVKATNNMRYEFRFRLNQKAWGGSGTLIPEGIDVNKVYNLQFDAIFDNFQHGSPTPTYMMSVFTSARANYVAQPEPEPVMVTISTGPSAHFLTRTASMMGNGLGFIPTGGDEIVDYLVAADAESAGELSPLQPSDMDGGFSITGVESAATALTVSLFALFALLLAMLL